MRHTFQLFAIATFIIGFIYLGFYHCYMKHHPSQGTDITKKRKPSKDEFTDVNLKADLDIPADLPVVYEDAMCNPAYETTEVEDDEEANKNSVSNGTQKK